MDIQKFPIVFMAIAGLLLIIQNVSGHVELTREAVRHPRLDFKQSNEEMITVEYQNGSVSKRFCCAKYYFNGESYQRYCENGCLVGTCQKTGKCICNLGYKLDSSAQTCKPICRGNCPQGHCIKPNLCACNEGYELNVTLQECQPICESNCANGFCSAPGDCSCNPGYAMNFTTKTCQPLCQMMKCPDHSSCLKSNKCECNNGYNYNAITRTCEPLCVKGCENGECIAPNNCKCNKGYSLEWNFIKNCSICKMDYCSSNQPCTNGHCLSNGACVCNEGHLNYFAFLFGDQCESLYSLFLKLVFVFCCIVCLIAIIFVALARNSLERPKGANYKPLLTPSDIIRKEYNIYDNC
uniref:EGF-like domain-containing protein n=1 Tax=Stomoxys calcitrans TaxID=35570 RepID=A0A1I8PWP7_STOCA